MIYKNNRPKLKIPLSPFEIVIQLITISGLVEIWLMMLLSLGKMPDRIPTHFGASGNVDGWGGKGSLLALPILMLVLYVMLSVFERFPHVYNYMCEITEQNAEFQYKNARMFMACLKMEMTLLFGYIEWSTIQLALGKASGLGAGFVPIYLIALFGTIILFILRMVRNR